MHIDNTFELPMAPAQAWPLLMDVPRTAACFPGVGEIQALDADQYQGRVTVKLGPLTMVFAGHLRIEARDDAALSATLNARWNETKGRGNALSTTRFALGPNGEGSGTRVTLATDLQLAGQVAQYGRGVGMISAISAELVAEFSRNLRARIQAAESGAPSAENPTAPQISGLTLAAKVLSNRLKR